MENKKFNINPLIYSENLVTNKDLKEQSYSDVSFAEGAYLSYSESIDFRPDRAIKHQLSESTINRYKKYLSEEQINILLSSPARKLSNILTVGDEYEEDILTPRDVYLGRENTSNLKEIVKILQENNINIQDDIISYRNDIIEANEYAKRQSSFIGGLAQDFAGAGVGWLYHAGESLLLDADPSLAAAIVAPYGKLKKGASILQSASKIFTLSASYNYVAENINRRNELDYRQSFLQEDFTNKDLQYEIAIDSLLGATIEGGGYAAYRGLRNVLSERTDINAFANRVLEKEDSLRSDAAAEEVIANEGIIQDRQKILNEEIENAKKKVNTETQADLQETNLKIKKIKERRDNFADDYVSSDNEFYQTDNILNNDYNIVDIANKGDTEKALNDFEINELETQLNDINERIKDINNQIIDNVKVRKESSAEEDFLKAEKVRGEIYSLDKDLKSLKKEKKEQLNQENKNKNSKISEKKKEIKELEKELSILEKERKSLIKKSEDGKVDPESVKKIKETELRYNNINEKINSAKNDILKIENDFSKISSIIEEEIKISENLQGKEINDRKELLKNLNNNAKKRAKNGFPLKPNSDNSAEIVKSLFRAKESYLPDDFSSVKKQADKNINDLSFTQKELEIQKQRIEKELKIKRANEYLTSDKVGEFEGLSEAKKIRDKKIKQQQDDELNALKEIRENNKEINKLRSELKALKETDDIKTFKEKYNELIKKVNKLKDEAVKIVNKMKRDRNLYIEEFRFYQKKLKEDAIINGINKSKVDAYVNTNLKRRFGFSNEKDYIKNLDALIKNQNSKLNDFASAEVNIFKYEMSKARTLFYNKKQNEFFDKIKEKGIDNLEDPEIKKAQDELNSVMNETNEEFSIRDQINDVKEKIDSDRILLTPTVSRALILKEFEADLEDFFKRIKIKEENIPSMKDRVIQQLQAKAKDYEVDYDKINSKSIVNTLKGIFTTKGFDEFFNDLSDSMKMGHRKFLDQYKNDIKKLIDEGYSYDQIKKALADAAYEYNKKNNIFIKSYEQNLKATAKDIQKTEVKNKFSSDGDTENVLTPEQKNVVDEAELIYNSNSEAPDFEVRYYDDDGVEIKTTYREYMKKLQEEEEMLDNAIVCMLNL